MAEGRLTIKTALPPLSRNANSNGSAVDLQGLLEPKHEQVVGVLSVGSQSGTTPTLDVKFQSSADGSTNWADIAGAAFTQVGAATGDQTIAFVPNQRYVRAVVTVGGTTPVYVCAAWLICTKTQ